MGLYQGLIEMFEYVIFWGGPLRVFNLTDHMIFVEDMEEVEEFFRGKEEISCPYPISDECLCFLLPFFRLLVSFLFFLTRREREKILKVLVFL